MSRERRGLLDPLLYTVFLRLLAGMVIAGVLFGLVIDPKISETVSRNVETTSGAGMSVIARVIDSELAADPGSSPPALALTREAFGVPAAIISANDVVLTDSQRARLDRGELILTGPRFAWTYIVRIGRTNKLLSIGPTQSVHPFGGLRGIGVGLLLVFGLSAGTYFLVSPLKRRLHALSKTAAELGRGVLTVRSNDHSGDAIGSLATSFNRMAEELQRLVGRQQELLRTVSHEVRTPIQRVHFALELARDAGDGAEREKGFARAESALEDLDRLIAELLTFARLGEQPSLVKKPVELERLIAGVVESLAELNRSKELLVHATPLAPVELDPRLIERAISNLIRNALRHAKSKVSITTRVAGGQIFIDVDDDGPGVAPEDRLRIFQPFQRAVRQGEEHTGFGLGLAIARRVAETHRGSIEVFDSELGGARFRLSLPAS